MRFPVVLFDLDGTLIDSGAMILDSFRHATRTVLRRDIPDEILVAAVGGSTLREQMRLLDEGRVDELVDAYREHNTPLHRDLQACPGVLDALERLHGDGRRLGIVTSKRHATIDLAFAVLPLREFFDVVVATEDTERHKPNPDPLLLALERLEAAPAEAAYVGDSPFDVQSAKAAGIYSIAVTWGGLHSRERLADERPDLLIDSVEELLGAV
jgi:pyrophosphatase PpaX